MCVCVSARARACVRGCLVWMKQGREKESHSKNKPSVEEQTVRNVVSRERIDDGGVDLWREREAEEGGVGRGLDELKGR